MEIVVGFQGKEHVTAGQVGRILAGMAGSGTYVLETQNRLAATVVTANQVRVDTGDLVMQGRVATVETPETLTIESGVTGQKRRDLIVARYTMEASTSVEGIELAVVKGTPVSYGEPSDPEVSEGSILDGDSPVEVPLYRITVDGLVPGTPEALLDTVPSVDSLRDSVSQSDHLYEGAWSSGKLTCPGISRYRVLIIFAAGSVTPIIGIKSSTQLYAFGGWVSSYPATHYYTFHATVDGDTLTYDYLHDTVIAENGNTVEKLGSGISGIFGVI